MIYKDFCIQPENELDERFVEAEMEFLIRVSIWQQNTLTIDEYKDIVSNHYTEWLETNGRSKTNYSH